jgi:hypothetical protein
MKKQNYNRNIKQQKQGLGNPKFKLRMKVCGGNASEDAGLMIRNTDVKTEATS